MGWQADLNDAVASLGFAARADGAALAYAKVDGRSGRGPDLLRVPFVCQPLPALQGRDLAYAAVAQVAAELLRRGEHVSAFEIVDERLVADLDERRALPQALAMPYVTLRCRLNRLHGAAVVLSTDGTCRDLAARARAEISLDAAA